MTKVLFKQKAPILDCPTLNILNITNGKIFCILHVFCHNFLFKTPILISNIYWKFK